MNNDTLNILMVCREIGNAGQSNATFAQKFTDEVIARGGIGDLTVRELYQMVVDMTAEFNRGWAQ